MKKCNILAIFALIYSFFDIILSIDINNVNKNSLFSKLINKITLRPLNIFSSVDFILDKPCKINPEKYFKSPNVILNCKLKETEHVSISFNRRDRRINIYQNDNIIKKIYIKLGEITNVDICIDNYNIKNNSGKSCRTITFWVINGYDSSKKKFNGYNGLKFNDDQFLNFIEGVNDVDRGTALLNDANNASINCVVLEKKIDGKTNKILLSPIDGVINVNVEVDSKLMLHLPQYQHECSNILDRLMDNSKNPSLLYFIDSNRLGFGPLSIDISSPTLASLGKNVQETKRSFFLSTLNKNNNKRGFALFVINYVKSKFLVTDCLQMIMDENDSGAIVADQKNFKKPINVFKCFYNDKNIDNNVQNVTIDVSKSDGKIAYVMKLIDTNNTFLYLNGDLQENGSLEHNISLKHNQKEMIEYVIKDRDELVISKIRVEFYRRSSYNYFHKFGVLSKYLAAPAILVDLKGVFDLWLISKLISSDKDIFDTLIGDSSENSLTSEQNNTIKKYNILDKLYSFITIDNESIRSNGNGEINAINGLFLSIIINLIALILSFTLKSARINRRNVGSYFKTKEVFTSVVPYTLLFTLYNSLNVIFISKINITVNKIPVSTNILKLFGLSCIVLSLLVYKMTSNLNRNNTRATFTYSPWINRNYVLKFPEFPYFQTIHWPIPTFAETNLLKIWVGEMYFLIEYKLNVCKDEDFDDDFYQLSIISAIFNGSNLTNKNARGDKSILFTPAAWIKTDVSGMVNSNATLFTSINLFDICTLRLSDSKDNIYIHHSQTSPNKSQWSLVHILSTVFLLFYSDEQNNIYFKQYIICLYIIFNTILKLYEYRESKIHKFQNEWFKSNLYPSKLIDISSYGTLIGLTVIKCIMYFKYRLNTYLMHVMIILCLFIIFSSIIPSILIVCIWTIDMIKYCGKLWRNLINLLNSFVRVNCYLKKLIKNSNSDNYLVSTNTSEFAYYVENNKSKSSLLSNAIGNVAKPLAELDVLKFTFTYNNSPISPTACYIPQRNFKKLLYYFGELKEFKSDFGVLNKSNLTIYSNDDISLNDTMANYFATIEISRPFKISKSIPNIHNNCLSLNINPPKIPSGEWNKLYDVNYDDNNHMLIITGPFIIPSGTFTVRASIKNGCKSDSDANFLTSIIADNCKCHYHGVLNVPINPDYIKYLNIYKKIHICMYSSGKSISFTINPKSTYIEINRVSNHMVLRSQNFVQGYVYKVQYKCLPNKTNTGFIEKVVADTNISKIEIPISIPKENFNYKLYEYHVTNFIDITCSIKPRTDHWGFQDEFISKIIKSYPKIWGLSNILDYKIPCSINRKLENGFYRITPKYNIAANIAMAQKECLMALYSTLILNRINSLEFVGFYFYDKEEINDFFSKFDIVLQLDDLWINPMSDSAINMYGSENMQKAYNALYQDLKSKLEFYINLSEQIVSHLLDMKSLYENDLVLQAIDGFDNLTLNNTCIDSAIELTMKRVSRDVPQDLIKKLQFPPVISGKNIKWNLHLSNQLDKWKNEIKSFFDLKIGVLNSFSMLTSSYAIPLDFTLSCLGNSLRRASNEINLQYRDEKDIEYKLTHIIITEQSLISAKNDWNIPSSYLHSTSFSAFMGYVKIKYPYDSLDKWHPTFMNWRPHGIIFDLLNKDHVYVKFTDILSLEIESEDDNSEYEPSILNGLLYSEKMIVLSLNCKTDSLKIINLESSNDYTMQGIVYKIFDNDKLYFKTTHSNYRSLELILDEYTTIRAENDSTIAMNVDEIKSINEHIQESHNEMIIK